MEQIEQDLRIDESALDVECLNQSELAWKYIKLAIHSRKAALLAAERAKTIRSELISEVNADSEKCIGKAKPNAADIEAYYRMQPRYKEAKAAKIAAELEAELVQQAKDLFVYQRKASLEQLVTLHGQHYFAGPKVSRDLSQEVQKQKESANEKVKAAMTRRRK
jgi:hypothetical protein